MSLINLAHVISQSADAIMREHLHRVKLDDVTPRQIAILSVIVGAGTPLSQTRIVDVTGIDRSTTSEMIYRMIDAGLIARQRNRKDRRAYDVEATAAGERIVRMARPAIKGAESELRKAWPGLDALAASRLAASRKEAAE